jgi:predicted metal-dependent hydrolase
MTERGRSTSPQRSTELGARQVEYTLQRSPRRRTIGLRIDDGGLRVAAPTWTSDREIEDALRAHARWILDKMRTWRAQQPSTPEPCFADGDLLLWLGEPLPIRRVPPREAIPQPCQPEQTLAAIPISIDCEDARAAVTAWYVAQATPWFRRRAQLFAGRLGIAPRELRISSARGRWGSCTSKGVIRLNWRLMQASPAEIDYVVAHELAHLAELNHSPAFWNTVARIYPEWSAASDLLDARDRLYRRI